MNYSAGYGVGVFKEIDNNHYIVGLYSKSAMMQIYYFHVVGI